MAQISTRRRDSRAVREPELSARPLVDEIGRYLAAVDLFRALGCEPTWREEVAGAAGRHLLLPGRPLDSDGLPA